MAQPKRKSPERATTRKRQPSRAAISIRAVASLLARHPRLWGGLFAFGVVFSFVAANALWYQPRHHPSPLLATRTFGDGEVAGRQPVADEPGVTTFRIERQTEDADQAPAAAQTKQPSELVLQVQKGLAARGLYDGPTDGVIGPKTTSAILFFQETEGLAMTGEPSDNLVQRLANVRRDVAVLPEERPSHDLTASTRRTENRPATRADASTTTDEIAALINNVPVPAAAETASNPALVMKIQKALVGMAYKNIKVDGVAGAATKAAIRNFEKSYRLPVTGEPSERVLKKLQAIGAI